MSANKKKKTQAKGNGVNFAITVVTLSVIFIFVGYLIGQYAVKALQQQHEVSMQRAQEGVVTQTVTSSNQAPIRTDVPPQEAAPSPPSASAKVESESSTALYRVQVGVFSERANAERMVEQLKQAGYEGIIISGPPHRVQTGAFSSQENAARLMDELHGKGFEAIIVR